MLYPYIFMLRDSVVDLLYVLGKWCPNKLSLGCNLSAGEWEKLLSSETLLV